MKDMLTKQNGLFQKGSYGMWNGGLHKAAYNLFWGLNLWAWNEDNILKWLTTPMWIYSYSFLTLKTRLQLTGSSLSYQPHTRDAEKIGIGMLTQEGPRSLFAGLIPFVLVNIAFAWSFPRFLSEKEKHSRLEHIIGHAPAQQVETKYWA